MATANTGHPTGFWFLFFGELAERCSFYGMRGLLAFYLMHVFGKTKGEASEVVHLYMAGCYATGLVGGVVADRFLGKYWTIVLFSVPYVIGQFLVGLSDLTLLYVALVILAFGSGVIKPNISALMGLTYDQQRPGQEQLRSRAFGYYYMAINVGSLLAYQVCPQLRDYYGVIDPATNAPTNPRAGYLAGFLFPAVLMVVALVVFAAGKRFYAREDIRADLAADDADPGGKWRVVGRLAGLFVLVMFFWAVFDQKATTWLYFANDYLDIWFKLPFEVNGKTDWRIPPESLASANPFLIICFVPLVNLAMSRLAKAGIHPRPTDKMIVGFFLTGLACAIHVAAGYAATGPDGSVQRVSMAWQLLAYAALTLAEVLISVTGLELAYTAAPRSMKGFVTALWLAPTFFANIIASQLAKTYPDAAHVNPVGAVAGGGVFADGPLVVATRPWYQFDTPQAYFLFLTGVLAVVAVAFVFVAIRFNRAQARAGQ